MTSQVFDLTFDILTLIPPYFSSIRDVMSFSLVCKNWHEALLLSVTNAPMIISNRYCHWNLHITHIIFNNLNYIIQQISQNDKRYAIKIIEFQIDEFHDTKLTDDMVECLILNCCNLRSVDFSHCNITDGAAKYLSSFTNLTSVDFSYCKVTDDTAKYLSQGLTNVLQSVSFGEDVYHYLTDESAKYLSLCLNLQNVNYDCCTLLTSEAVKFVSKCSKLQSISFFGCDQITDEGIKYISDCSNLHSVDFSWCILLTNEAVK